jgi:Flp pilus assembly protein TadG
MMAINEFNPTSRTSDWKSIFRLARRYRRDANGTTAVEFAILAFPFFVLLFAIIEMSLIFFAGQILESSVDEVARMVRTGQINNTSNSGTLRTAICDEASILFDCAGIKVDMKVVDKFDDLGNPPTPNPDTNITDFSQYSFQPPCPEKVVMITASYEWPIFTYLISNNLYPTKGNNPAFRKVLLNAVGVFKTEPYPAVTGGAAC